MFVLLRARLLPRPARGAHRDLATSLLSYLINSTNTSFEIVSLSGASRTMLPSRSTKRVRPSLRSRERMRPRPKSQVWFAPPVFQVVLRFVSRLCPIRNLVVTVPRRAQRLLRHLIKLHHVIFAGHRTSAVLFPALQQLLAEPAVLIDLQEVNGNMLRSQPRQFLQRLPPACLRLM